MRSECVVLLVVVVCCGLALRWCKLPGAQEYSPAPSARRMNSCVHRIATSVQPAFDCRSCQQICMRGSRRQICIEIHRIEIPRLYDCATLISVSIGLQQACSLHSFECSAGMVHNAGIVHHPTTPIDGAELIIGLRQPCSLRLNEATNCLRCQ